MVNEYLYFGGLALLTWFVLGCGEYAVLYINHLQDPKGYLHRFSRLYLLFAAPGVLLGGDEDFRDIWWRALTRRSLK